MFNRARCGALGRTWYELAPWCGKLGVLEDASASHLDSEMALAIDLPKVSCFRSNNGVK